MDTLENGAGRYYHNIGPPNENGNCMHVDTTNALHPLTSLFGLMTRAGYETGVQPLRSAVCS